MASGPPKELTLHSVKSFLQAKGGRATNHELVQYFRPLLTNAENKDIARNNFKQYVNTLSNISVEDGNKFLVLKNKYLKIEGQDSNARAYDYGHDAAVYSPNISEDFSNSPGADSFPRQRVNENVPIPSQQFHGSPQQYNRPYPQRQTSQPDYHQARPPQPSHGSLSRQSSYQNSLSTDSVHSEQSHGDQSDYSAPPRPPKSLGVSGNSSPHNNNPAPRYRTPPPYRAPPPGPQRRPDSSMSMNSYPRPPSFQSPHHGGVNFVPQQRPPMQPQYTDHRYEPPQGQMVRKNSYQEDFYGQDSLLQHSYNEPSDLGIPLAPSPLHRTVSHGSNSHLNVSPAMPSAPLHRPNALPVQPLPYNPNHVTKAFPSKEEMVGIGKLKQSHSQTFLPGSQSATPSPDDDSSPIVPLRKHKLPSSEYDKENHTPPSEHSRPVSGGSGGDDSDGRAATSLHRRESEKKISVKEKTQIFNKMASETNLNDRLGHKTSSKGNRSSRAEKEYYDNMSILAFGEEGQDWLVAACSADFNEILRLLKIHPQLVRWKDRCNSALHWAAKHGRVEVVKLLAGTHQADPNAKSGYTPLHLAAMYNRRDVFDLLVHYGAELNVRDYSGKKPRQYGLVPSNTISPEHDKRIIQRRHSIKDTASFLRIGSLNVKVRRTTEAFNSLLSRDNNLDSNMKTLHKTYGSNDSLQEEREGSGKLMPPPLFGPSKKKKSKKERESAPTPSRPASTPLLSSLSSSLASLSSSPKLSSEPRGVVPPQPMGEVPFQLWQSGLPPVHPHHHGVVPQYMPSTEAHDQPAHPRGMHQMGTMSHHQDSDSDNACGFDSHWR